MMVDDVGFSLMRWRLIEEERRKRKTFTVIYLASDVISILTHSTEYCTHFELVVL